MQQLAPWSVKGWRVKDIYSLTDNNRFLSKSIKFPFMRLVLLALTSVLTLGALIMPVSARPSQYLLKPGDVATQDIQAPSTLSFESKILTEQAREDAKRAVPNVYLPADPSITRRQIEKLRTAFKYISIVREDALATQEEKISDLRNLAEIDISPQLAQKILDLSDEDWETTQNEALIVLEKTMRTTIREDQLNEVRHNVPALISFSLSQNQAEIVEELAAPFVIANSMFSETQTEVLREKAIEAVAPVSRKFVSGEIIVQRGQVITPLIWEALNEYNLVQPQNITEDVIGASALVVLAALFIAVYLTKSQDPLQNDRRGLLIIAISFIGFLYLARLVIPNRLVIPYFFPIPALGLTISSLYAPITGMIFSLLLSILAAYGTNFSLDLTLFYLLASLCGIIILGKGRRIASFFWAGIAVAAAGSSIIIAYRLPGSRTDLFGIATLIGAAFLNGMLSASIALLLQFIFAQILGVTTALQLLEISRPDHPLLQFILQNAPGTYQHSLMVANLAEQGAKAIGADALLVRVGALHHDAGKALNPSFFIENQVRGKLNPHNDIDPKTSSQTIIKHVADGIKLAQKYRLPPRIQDFILEHHGTLITQYQYNQALKAANNKAELVDIEDYRYPGPKPGSRETALLMLADGVEARARAEVPQSDDEIRALIRDSFDYIRRSGQLDNTQITYKELNQVAEAFVATLKTTYHPRIKYPKATEETSKTDKASTRKMGEEQKTIPAKSI